VVSSPKQNLSFLQVESRYYSLLEKHNLIFGAAKEFILFEVFDCLDVVVITGHDKHCALLDLLACMFLSG
jgi:hypothetical protein